MNIKKVKCLIPFTVFQLVGHGYVRSCCASWRKGGRIGNMYSSSSYRDIWNGKKILRIRQDVLNDKTNETCNTLSCPYARSADYIDLVNFKTDDVNLRKVVDQVREGKYVLDTGPLYINTGDSDICNLRCIMCLNAKPLIRRKSRHSDVVFSSFLEQLVPSASELTLSGNGDPFARKEVVKFLVDRKNSEKYPNLRIELFTNGMLLTESMWEKIKHNKFSTINVSIDAATKSTYEYVRKNGTWEVLLKNLCLIGELRKKQFFSNFIINFVVIKSNYREMIDFVTLGFSVACDEVRFHKIIGVADIRENILLTRNIAVLSSVAKTLEDPIFNDAQVDVTRLAAFRKFLGRKETTFDRLLTIFIERMFHRCLKYYYPLRQQIFSIYNYFFVR
jgi:pyruvate-formate lyase-activating enzyme